MTRTASPQRDGSDPVTILISVAVLVLVWIGAARAVADPTILPTPLEVWQVTLVEARSGDLFYHCAVTLRRVALAFAVAFGVGAGLGLVMGLWPQVNRWLNLPMLVLQNIPALVVIVLCYLWIGLNELAAIVAVSLNKTAMVALTIREGVLARDPRIADMAQVFRMPPITRLRHEIWPQLWPFVAVAVRNGLAIIWKIVLVVEFLGRSDGVGFQIHLYFQLFEIGPLLSYALSFVVIMLAIERALIVPLERRATAWRVSAT
jgi:NitT/TauT family transport system permease protein